MSTASAAARIHAPNKDVEDSHTGNTPIAGCRMMEKPIEIMFHSNNDRFFLYPSNGWFGGTPLLTPNHLWILCPQKDDDLYLNDSSSTWTRCPFKSCLSLNLCVLPQEITLNPTQSLLCSTTSNRILYDIPIKTCNSTQESWSMG